MHRVKGKIAIVTGAGRGIGRAIACRLAAEGAAVIVTDKDADRAEQTAGLIANTGAKTLHHHLDITDEQAWQALFALALSKFKRIDVLVNNAGICILKPITEMSLDEFQHINKINAIGTFIGTRAAVLAMRQCATTGEPASGSIINIASTAAATGLPGGAAYCASKGAVVNMCKAMGVECGEQRDAIRINVINPGVIRSALAEGIYGAGYFADKNHLAGLPLKTYGRPEDIAAAVVYLAADESRLVTAAELSIDGGLSSAYLGGR